MSSATGGFIAPEGSPPPEDAALAEILQIVVAGITALPGNLVRPRYQVIPPPQPEVTVNWCAIGVTNETNDPAMILVHHGAGDGSSTSQMNVTIDVLCSFYGPAGFANARLFSDGVMIAQNREPWQLAGIGLVSPPDPTRNASQEINQRWQVQADVAFRLRVPFSRTWAINNLLAAQGAIVSDNGDSETITVNEGTGT